MNFKTLLSIAALVGAASAAGVGPHGSPLCVGCKVTGTGGDLSLWGWENDEACEIDVDKCGDLTPPEGSGPHGSPMCKGCKVTGTGGDKSLWGWENDEACEIDYDKCGLEDKTEKPKPKSAEGIAAAATKSLQAAAAGVTSAQAPVAAAPVASAPVASAPVSAAPVASAPVASAPVASAPVASAPVAAAPVAADAAAAVTAPVAPVGAVVPVGSFSQTTKSIPMVAILEDEEEEKALAAAAQAPVAAPQVEVPQVAAPAAAAPAAAPFTTKTIPIEAYSDPLAFPPDYVEGEDEEEPVAAPVAAPQVEVPQVAAPVAAPQAEVPQVAALPDFTPVPKVSVPSGLFLPSNLPSDLPDSGVPFYTNPEGLLDIPDIPAAQIVEAPVVASNPFAAAPTTPQVAAPQVAAPQVAAPQVAAPQVAAPVASAPVAAAPVAAAPAAAPAVAMPDIKVLGEKKTGKTTRYWDCCKPSCAWSGKANVSSPVSTCSASGSILSNPDAKSGCDGGESYMCTDQQPWAINDQLSYGFAAASISGESESTWCCACYRLTFTSTSIAGKQLIVQVTNTGGDLGENHFDLQMPGGGLGIFDGCSSQFNVDADSWGERYGGLSDISECAKLPASLQAGCEWRFGWFENADNPEMEFEEVECPAEITDKTGCIRL